MVVVGCSCFSPNCSLDERQTKETINQSIDPNFAVSKNLRITNEAEPSSIDSFDSIHSIHSTKANENRTINVTQPDWIRPRPRHFGIWRRVIPKDTKCANRKSSIHPPSRPSAIVRKLYETKKEFERISNTLPVGPDTILSDQCGLTSKRRIYNTNCMLYNICNSLSTLLHLHSSLDVFFLNEE